MSDSDVDIAARAFYVEDTGEEFDLQIPPTSGLEYLRRVQAEALQCPNVVVADIDTSRYTDKQTVKLHARSGYNPAPKGYAPSMKWQKQQIVDFSKLRQKIAQHKAVMKKQNATPKVRLPLPDDVEKWCSLCFGHLQQQRCVEGSTSSTTSANVVNSQDISTRGVTTLQNNGQGTPPLLSIVSFMDQHMVQKVIDYHINWFEATGFSSEQGRWFFALLACLEKPLPPETCASLRSFARNCATLRATLESPEDSRLIELNLFICLVARYFDQADLADNT